MLKNLLKKLRCILGGERETTLEKKDKKEGGIATLGGFRIHESNGEVHFHDDKNKLKAAVPLGAWYKAWDKLRGEPATWQYIDATNNTNISVETRLEKDEFDVIVSITPIKIGKDYAKLNTFSKRK
jgi:hypothetical protein